MYKLKLFQKAETLKEREKTREKKEKKDKENDSQGPRTRRSQKTVLAC